MIKRLLQGLFLLALFSGVAAAGWNIRQLENGGANWVSTGLSGDTVPIGDSGLTVDLTDISTASTTFVVSHKPGKLKIAYSTAHAALTLDDANLSFLVAAASFPVGESGFQFVPVTSGTGATNNIVIGGTGAAGDMDSITFDSSIGHTVDVAQGAVIAIVTDGASTTTSRATITLVIE